LLLKTVEKCLFSSHTYLALSPTNLGCCSRGRNTARLYNAIILFRSHPKVKVLVAMWRGAGVWGRNVCASPLFVSNPLRFLSPTYLPVPLHSVSSEERLQRARKLTLVVDLDKTVLHSSFDPFALAAYDVWRRDGTNIPICVLCCVLWLCRVLCDVWSLVSGLWFTACGVDTIVCVACVVSCFCLFCFVLLFLCLFEVSL
jgi:hypothetical protein